MMDHLEAASLGATEKYLLGTLDDETRDAFEEHFFDCLECADEVRIASAILAAAGAGEDAALPAILPASSTRQPVVRAPTAQPAPAAPIPIQSAARRRLARATGLTAAVAAMAASLCLIAYQNAVVIPDLKDQAGHAGSIQPVRSYFLTQTRGEPAEIQVTAGDRVVALTLSRSSDRSFAAYRCELRDDSDRVVQTVVVPRPTTEELELLLPVAGLSPGDHVLVVEGLEDLARASEATPVARYAFRVERS